FLDLDRFKVVNDTLGHRVGDLLLQEVAKRLQQLLEPDDLLARLGGDEFAVVLTAADSRATLEAVASLLIAASGYTYEIQDHGLRGAGTVAACRQWDGAPGCFHSGCGRHRAYYFRWRLGAGRSVPHRGGMAIGSQSIGQFVARTVHGPRPLQHGAECSGRIR